MLLLPGVGRRAEPAARIPEEAVVEVPDVPEPIGEVAAEEQAANAWRQAVKGAWEQSDETRLLGLQLAEVGMAGSDPQAAANTDPDQGFKVKIKNTFIDVEEESTELATRGAQTAMARLAGSNEPEFGAEHYATQDGHVYMSKKIISEHGYGCGGRDPKAPSWEPKAPTPSTCLPLSLSDSGVPTTILGKELTFDSQEASLKSSPYSDHASLSLPQQDSQAFSPTLSPPMAPPPAYAAPEAFEEEPTSQPPPTPPGSNQANGEANGEAKYIVKNTFIEIETDTTPRDQRFTQSCLARFSSPRTPQFWTTGGSMLPPTPSGQKMETVHEAFLEPPSLGSEVHGKFSQDGQPVCQPCAWFYKESGCRNASSCRYCHLCPQGELKNRKKAKIARLRNQEAAATTSPKSAASPSSTPAKNDKDVAAVSLSNSTTPVNAAS